MTGQKRLEEEKKRIKDYHSAPMHAVVDINVGMLYVEKSHNTEPSKLQRYSYAVVYPSAVSFVCFTGFRGFASSALLVAAPFAF